MTGAATLHHTHVLSCHMQIVMFLLKHGQHTAHQLCSAMLKCQLLETVILPVISARILVILSDICMSTKYWFNSRGFYAVRAFSDSSYDSRSNQYFIFVLLLTADKQKICQWQHTALWKQKVNYRGEEYVINAVCQK